MKPTNNINIRMDTTQEKGQITKHDFIEFATREDMENYMFARLQPTEKILLDRCYNGLHMGTHIFRVMGYNGEWSGPAKKVDTGFFPPEYDIYIFDLFQFRLDWLNPDKDYGIVSYRSPSYCWAFLSKKRTEELMRKRAEVSKVEE
jgi:hypothetical protein